MSLFPTFTWGDLNLTDWPYSIEFGSDFGTMAEVTSALMDDEEDRNLSFVVLVEGTNLGEIAQHEAALRRESLRQFNALTVEPGDGIAPATVFETEQATMTLLRDDDGEVAHLRRWQLTIPAGQAVRSSVATVFTALEVGADDEEVINDCTSTTGWTGYRGTTPETPSTLWEAGSVGIVDLDSFVTSPEFWHLTLTQAMDFTVMRYLVVEARTVSAVNDTLMLRQYHSGGISYLNAMSVRAMGSPGWYEYVYVMTPAITTALTFSHESAAGESWQGLLIREVTQRSTPGRPRQQVRTLEIGGTERGPASMRISSQNGTDDLGLMIVHTSPEDNSGYSPQLRRWRVSGNTVTVDPATFSGAREELDPNFVQFDIPIVSLPDGGYQLMMLARTTSAGWHTIAATIQSRQNGTTLGETTWEESVNFPLANDWLLVPMGIYNIPIVAAKSGEFRVAFRTPDTTTVEYDEAWLFKMDDDCGLTIGTVTAPHLWIDSADTTSRVPRIWQGDAADKSDARHPHAMMANAHHMFGPPRVRVFTASSNTDWPNVELTAYKWWHTHAAED